MCICVHVHVCVCVGIVCDVRHLFVMCVCTFCLFFMWTLPTSLSPCPQWVSLGYVHIRYTYIHVHTICLHSVCVHVLCIFTCTCPCTCICLCMYNVYTCAVCTIQVMSSCRVHTGEYMYSLAVYIVHVKSSYVLLYMYSLAVCIVHVHVHGLCVSLLSLSFSWLHK